jgi:hypothetical protein
MANIRAFHAWSVAGTPAQGNHPDISEQGDDPLLESYHYAQTKTANYQLLF